LCTRRHWPLPRTTDAQAAAHEKSMPPATSRGTSPHLHHARIRTILRAHRSPQNSARHTVPRATRRRTHTPCAAVGHTSRGASPLKQRRASARIERTPDGARPDARPDPHPRTHSARRGVASSSRVPSSPCAVHARSLANRPRHSQPTAHNRSFTISVRASVRKMVMPMGAATATRLRCMPRTMNA